MDSRMRNMPEYAETRLNEKNQSVAPQERRFRSRRQSLGYVNAKPWLQEKKSRWNCLDYVLPWIGCLIGLGIVGYFIYAGYASVEQHKYCLVFEDDFSSKSLNKDIWEHEIQTGGFGVGSFDWATDDTKNSFIEDDGLHIRATLTTESTDITEKQLLNGYTVNLTRDGTCTSKDYRQCGVRSNSTTSTIINPVRSARIRTKSNKAIKYGRVEVTAQLPNGDWLWPALWMMPVNETYGKWPRSGEIDIMESRGNSPSYKTGGINKFTSSLHWGPTTMLDRYYKTLALHKEGRTDLSKRKHVFGIEWSENTIYTFIDYRLQTVLYTKMNKPFFDRGGFPPADPEKGQRVDNPWEKTGRTNSPFDQYFYLILNLSVGGTNGYFPDGEGDKGWIDGASSAALDFWRTRDKWQPSWKSKNKNHDFIIQKVAVWQQCDENKPTSKVTQSLSNAQ